jgi:phosphate transport system substrate-binding protein
MSRGRSLYLLAPVAAGLLLAGNLACAPSSRDDTIGTIKVTGSDTMVNLANAWQEAFQATHPDISLQVTGGGSGVGINNLIAGEIEIATASRPMEPKEIELAKSTHGKDPKQFVVARDALAIFVHKKNPLDSISLAELAEIYGENGTATTWKAIHVDFAECPSKQIVPIGRQNSSGTYAYFREAVLGKKREYRQGLTSQTGSSDVVALVSKTPCAIGYSGMGYRTDDVKVLDVSKEKGQRGIPPTAETALDGSYPISRPLYLYTLGEPTGAVQEFIQWVRSAEGQRIVEEQGFVPVSATAEVSKTPQESSNQ